MSRACTARRCQGESINRFRRDPSVAFLAAAFCGRTCSLLFSRCASHASRRRRTHEFNLSTALFTEITDNYLPFPPGSPCSPSAASPGLSITKHFILMTAGRPAGPGLNVLPCAQAEGPLPDPDAAAEPLRSTSSIHARHRCTSPCSDPRVDGSISCASPCSSSSSTANLLGMIPPFAPIKPSGESEAVWLGGAVTGNLATTLALGLITFIVFNVSGMRAKGALGYWRRLVPEGRRAGCCPSPCCWSSSGSCPRPLR